MDAACEYQSFWIESTDPEKDAREVEEASPRIKTRPGRGGYLMVIPRVIGKTLDNIVDTIVDEGMGRPGREREEV